MLVCICVCAKRDHHKMLDPIELESQDGGSHPTWVLETELQASARAAGMLSHLSTPINKPLKITGRIATQPGANCCKRLQIFIDTAPPPQKKKKTIHFWELGPVVWRKNFKVGLILRFKKCCLFSSFDSREAVGDGQRNPEAARHTQSHKALEVRLRRASVTNDSWSVSGKGSVYQLTVYIVRSFKHM